MAHKRATNRRSGWLLALMAAVALAASVGMTALGADSTPHLQQDLAATATQAAIRQRAIKATLTAQAQPPTPTHTPTRQPTPTHTPQPEAPTATNTRVPRPASPLAESLVRGLNIRSGPGTGYAIVGNASLGQSLPVTGQFAGCAWLQVLTQGGGTGWISGSPSFSSLNVPCSTLRAVSAPAQAAAPTRSVQPTPTPRPASVQPQQPTPTPRPTQSTASAAPAEVLPGIMTSFEPLGNWRRGDEANGTLEQTTVDGDAVAELTYDFPAEAGSKNYVVFLAQPPLPIPGSATGLQVQVYGDGSGHFLNAWVADSVGQTWQLTFGRIKHTGWAPMSTSVEASTVWPNGPLGDFTEDKLVPPYYFKAFVLDGVPDGVASSGVIYLDNLSSY